MQLIRGSEVQDFLRCRKRWDYRWVQHLKAKRPDGKLFTGTLIHQFLETYYESGYPAAYQAMEELFHKTDTSRMDQIELDELWDMACKVTENYVAQWGHIDKDWEVIATELKFAIPLETGINYEGTIDLIFKDGDGRLFFMDHKTTTSIERYQKNTEMDRQISRYWWALQQLIAGKGKVLQKYTSDIDGTEKEQWVDISVHTLWGHLGYGRSGVSGFIYNIILKDSPEPPGLLKKGGLSVAKNQKTTYAVYFQALKDNGFADDYGGHYPEYDEILDHLKKQEDENGNRFFRRIPVTRNQAEIQAAIDEFYWTARDTIAVREHGVSNRSTYRNITHDCSWDCQFKALCVAEFDGSNAGMIKNLAYEIDDKLIEGDTD